MLDEIPIHDLEQKTLQELTTFLKKQFIKHDIDSSTENCYFLKTLDTAVGCKLSCKYWKFVDGKDFPFLANRIGEIHSTLYLGDNGVIYHLHRRRFDIFLVPVNSDLMAFAYGRILNKINDWLLKFEYDNIGAPMVVISR